MTFRALPNLVFCWLTEAKSQGVKGPNMLGLMPSGPHSGSSVKPWKVLLLVVVVSLPPHKLCIHNSSWPAPASRVLGLEAQDNTPSSNFSLCGCSGN